MNVTRRTLRSLIGEHGTKKQIPEFVIDQSVKAMTDEVRLHLRRHIQSTSNSSSEARESLRLIDSSLKQFEKDVADQLREKLHAWTGVM